MVLIFSIHFYIDMEQYRNDSVQWVDAMARREEADRYLPMKTAEFHVLLALADEPRHGYAIRAAAEALTGGAVKLWPVTLYGSIRELHDQGLIEEAHELDEGGDDARRRYYRITKLGTRVLSAETARLRAIVEHAEATKALGRA
jgi:DNA-binding PadR family transcriptional regulator